jgi:alpha-N-arabinofuranosidase
MTNAPIPAGQLQKTIQIVCTILFLASMFSKTAHGQATNTTVLKISADEMTAKVSPQLYGLMTEEINYSYDGGLYAELVRNRTFKWNNRPVSTNSMAASFTTANQKSESNTNEATYWHLIQEGGGAGAISLDSSEPMNSAMDTSLKLEISKAGRRQKVGIANDGFWGIPVFPETKYRASFYARTDKNFDGPLTVEIVSTNSGKVYASGTVRNVSGDWKKYEVTLATGNVAPSKDNQLRITVTKPGTIWFSCVSLFPPTYNERPNGRRRDIMQLLADMHPAFLRFPGGNYVEGNTFDTRFDWKKTVGDISQRPGHYDDAWHYWSTDGMGLLEFLEWCEDLHMQPVLAVYAAYSMRQGSVTNELDFCVKEAMDELEYVTGDANTKWGAQRAKDGHPAPFQLEYVEIGNEDNLGTGGRTYDQRFTAFYDAIKAKYPNIQVISTATSRTRILHSRTPDVFDDHFYNSSMQMQSDTHHYDNYDRSGPKIFVGEWATREGSPTPNMNAALGDAAWMTGMERNSDIVIMASYAPLFVNVNPGGMQWRTDLIGYDALTSYGSPSYYAQKIFSLNQGDAVLPVAAENIPTREWQPPARRGGTPPPVAQVPFIFYNATRDTKNGMIFLKVVNTGSEARTVQIEIRGALNINPVGEAVVLSASAADATDSIMEPNKVIPVTSKADGLGTDFTRVFAPYSITILRIPTGVPIEPLTMVERKPAEAFTVHSQPAAPSAPAQSTVASSVTGLKVVKVDSEETAGEDGKGANAVDGNPSTFWHTQWQDASPEPPHEIIIELPKSTSIKGFAYLPRQDESENGIIKDYEFYASADVTNFGEPVAKGSFEGTKDKKSVTFVPVTCRFVKLKALSELNGGPWTSAAEIGVISAE